MWDMSHAPNHFNTTRSMKQEGLWFIWHVVRHREGDKKGKTLNKGVHWSALQDTFFFLVEAKKKEIELVYFLITLRHENISLFSNTWKTLTTETGFPFKSVLLLWFCVAEKWILLPHVVANRFFPQVNGDGQPLLILSRWACLCLRSRKSFRQTGLLLMGPLPSVGQTLWSAHCNVYFHLLHWRQEGIVFNVFFDHSAVFVNAVSIEV